MNITPMSVITRPFAIEPITNVMLPDGIFDNALFDLRIACHFTNTSGQPLKNVSLYLESVGDPGVAPEAQTHRFASVPAGASVLVMWKADFRNASPGKRAVSFIARADGFSPSRSIQTIFISQTRFDSVNNRYTCTIEEGTLTVSRIGAIVQRPGWGRQHDGKCECLPEGGPWIPTGMTLDWSPNPAYHGLHGDLPFSDPWWKVLAAVVCFVAAVVAIVAAAKGMGTAAIGFSGRFEETDPSVSCCTPDVGAGPERDFTVAGAASAIATLALAVAMSDAADPFWRGQGNTPPASGESTIGERVVAKWKLRSPPNAGTPYAVDVKWDYNRFTTGRTYEYAVEETQENIHVSEGVDLEVPTRAAALQPLWVRAKFRRTGETLYRGAELYAFAQFRSPSGLCFVVPMTDDGLGYDPSANDGIYAGSLDMEFAARKLLEYDMKAFGTWRIYVFAQDVNQTKAGTPPEIAAQHIGGFFVASAVSLSFDPSLPCPLAPHAIVPVS